MMKLDMEIAKTKYFNEEKQYQWLSWMKGVMEGVEPKMRRPIIAEFYGKMFLRGGSISSIIFNRWDVKKVFVFWQTHSLADPSAKEIASLWGSWPAEP